jgi:hypothetical protein
MRRSRLVDAIVKAALNHNITQLSDAVRRAQQIDITDRWGLSPFLIVAMAHDGDAARLLVDSGANPDQVGPTGKSGLVYAVLTVFLEPRGPQTVGSLLELGTDPNLRTNDGRTALEIVTDALRKGHRDPNWMNEFARSGLARGAPLRSAEEVEAELREIQRLLWSTARYHRHRNQQS